MSLQHWEYYDNSTWVPFDLVTSTTIELAFIAGDDDKSIQNNGLQVDIDFNEMNCSVGAQLTDLPLRRESSLNDYIVRYEWEDRNIWTRYSIRYDFTLDSTQINKFVIVIANYFNYVKLTEEMRLFYMLSSVKVNLWFIQYL